MEEVISKLRHLLATVFLAGFSYSVVIPTMVDVTTDALCPGRQDQCPLVFYLTGFQDAIIGLGAMVMTPWIGSLSDKYGRKNLLTLPILLSAIPTAIFAFGRSESFFYAYYVVRTFTAALTGGTLSSLALAYAADKVLVDQRLSAFGIVSAFFSGSYLCGNLAARFLSIDAIFQVAVCASLFAIAYVRIFLEESVSNKMDLLSRPILKTEEDGDDADDVPQLPPSTAKTIPSFKEITSLLGRSSTFSRTLVVCFFNGIALGWTQASLLYYFKARFLSDKDQFASLLILIGAFGAISQLLILSIAWSFWVVYASSTLFLLAWCVMPAACSIASKQVEAEEQGKAQGCIFGIQSFACAISPLVFNPLAALFLSKNAPFQFPGFTLLCLGFFTLVAFVLSLTIKENPSISSEEDP
ncbi:hippocampus abundant transcript-like protein 1 isoform X2 [Cucurbita moschata]|uniref:Hippocampus abundant transcript-like protein 1 isoform X2 n=1 Tax=Cucurbita moschata TaxID=3662 RepID=A0A6J1G5D3_CUCMO|nr:hippocampus abundant transcript-like protein 1 isoform X2 [Cucurbita moschata]